MLEIKNISVKLSEFNLKDISVNINKGEYFAILGPSGSGKTVLLETIAGMYSVDNGDIFHGKKSLLDLNVDKRKIGFVYQNYELFPFLNVFDNIAFGLKLRKLNKNIIREKVEKYLDLFNIKHLEKRFSKNLSGGECQRVALARALIIEPKILLLDEPLSALDKFTKEILIEEIKNINKRFKVTVIHVTHDLDEAIYLGDRIGIMKNGEMKKILSSLEFKTHVEKGTYKRFFE